MKFHPDYGEMSLTVHPEMKERDGISSGCEKKKKRRVNTSSPDEIF